MSTTNNLSLDQMYTIHTLLDQNVPIDQISSLVRCAKEKIEEIVKQKEFLKNIDFNKRKVIKSRRDNLPVYELFKLIYPITTDENLKKIFNREYHQYKKNARKESIKKTHLVRRDHLAIKFVEASLEILSKRVTKDEIKAIEELIPVYSSQIIKSLEAHEKRFTPQCIIIESEKPVSPPSEPIDLCIDADVEPLEGPSGIELDNQPKSSSDDILGERVFLSNSQDSESLRKWLMGDSKEDVHAFDYIS